VIYRVRRKNEGNMKYTATIEGHTLTRNSKREYNFAWALIKRETGELVDSGFSKSEPKPTVSIKMQVPTWWGTAAVRKEIRANLEKEFYFAQIKIKKGKR
jgi:hypothetical protein